MNVWIKVCGVTTVEDARAAIAAGVDAIGLNFVPSSKRFLAPEAAAALIREAGRDAVRWVGVVADQPPRQLEELLRRVELDQVQLHGKETPAELEALLPHAFKAVAIAGPADVERARRYGGDPLLVDAHVPGLLGGSGQTFDWTLVRELVRERRVVLAGGLRPDNVADAIRELRPWGVDVASGVELAPGRKDPRAVWSFVERARAAARELTGAGPLGAPSGPDEGGRS
ncbi:MAG: phosphoribosylanthranilate isomerase [Myxococcales bacterium]|nr:phosphoribosylanthranilate isomerase [Myxococcales bacterium]